MQRLRARHWLAVTLAATLIVVAWSTETTEGDSDTKLITVAGSRGAGRVSNSVGYTEPTGPAAAESPALAGQRATSGVDSSDQNSGSADGAEADASEGQADAEPGPVGPFTGLPVAPGSETRSALIMKIDNHPNARPQTGLDQADIVFDMRAEVVNRFAAVFQSTVPNPVGPVRSSRTSDFDILRGFDTPIYGSSGGNDHVLAGLRQLPIVALTNYSRTEYYRDRSRSAPHNLFVDGNVLYDLAPDDLPTPEPWFEYRGVDEPLPDEAFAVAGPVAIDFTGSSAVTHEWDAGVGGWLRTQDGEPHVTSAGEQLAPENVVIMITDYVRSAADAISPEVRSTGSGELVVLTDGHAIRGTWERNNPEDKPVMVDRSGAVIRLTPGRTWVLLPEPNQVSFPDGAAVDAGTATAGASEPVVSAQNGRCSAFGDPGNCWPWTVSTDID